MNNTETGKIGEDIASEFLSSKSYRIIRRNFRTKLGEIDIIAFHQEYLVFIEVKTRRSIQYGYPREAVDWAKQHKIRQVANCFVVAMGFSNINIRFDVVEIILDRNSKVKSIELYENAFC